MNSLVARADADALAYLLNEPICFPPKRSKVRGADGRFHSEDGHASTVPEWDWYWQLPESERKRLRAWFSEGGLAPDQYAAIYDPGGDVEAAMEEWRLATSLHDQARLLEELGDVPEEPAEPCRPDGAHLVGPTEIAGRLKVSRNTVSKWRERYLEFPAPLAYVGAGRKGPTGAASEGTPIYFWPDVAAWASSTGR